MRNETLIYWLISKKLQIMNFFIKVYFCTLCILVKLYILFFMHHVQLQYHLFYVRTKYDFFFYNCIFIIFFPLRKHNTIIHPDKSAKKKKCRMSLNNYDRPLDIINVHYRWMLQTFVFLILILNLKIHWQKTVQQLEK